MKKLKTKNLLQKYLTVFLVNTGTNLAAKTPLGRTNFESYLPNITATLQENSLTEEKFKNYFFLLKINKSYGYDNIHLNFIRNLYNELKPNFMNIFNLSLTTRIKNPVVPDRIKIAKVTPIFKIYYFKL